MLSMWSDVPNDLMENVYARIFPRDHREFTSVCSSWRSVGLEQKDCYLPRKTVGLIVPGETEDSETRRLLEPVQGRYSNDNVAVNLQIPHSYYCCGSSLGWLVLVDDSFDMQLFNPMTGVKFQLPSGTSSQSVSRCFDETGKYTVTKAVLSCDPYKMPSQSIVFILYGMYYMAFCKIGDTKWTTVEKPEDEEDEGYRSYDDVIYYDGKFCAVYNSSEPGGVVSCDLSDSDHPVVTDYAPPPTCEIFCMTRYLVESNGDLFQLRRRLTFDLDKVCYNTDSENYDDFDEVDAEEIDDGRDEDDNNESNNEDEDMDEDEDEVVDGDDDDDVDSNGDGGDVEYEEPSTKELIRRYRTFRFKIYKLIKCDGYLRGWKKMDSIGDNTFFVGYNSSFSLSAADYSGCKPNTVYFTDSSTPFENSPEPIRHDIGVYNLEDKSVAEVYPMNSKPIRPPPFWFTPIPWKSQVGSKAGEKEQKQNSEAAIHSMFVAYIGHHRRTVSR